MGRSVGWVSVAALVAGACAAAPEEEVAVRSQAVIAGHERIPKGATWTYLVVNGDAGFSWTTNNFDPAGWLDGAGPLGYGEPYLATTVGWGEDPNAKYVTTRFRTQFTVDDPARVRRMIASVMYDDGIVVYLNGRLIAKESMPAEGFATWETLALPHEAKNEYVDFDWSPSSRWLHPGLNTLGVEVHQADVTSSDLVFDLGLEITVDAPGEIDRGAAWAYWDGGGDLGTAWRARDYDDGAWAVGAGPLGYGESYLGTTIAYGPSPTTKHVTSYFRRSFEVDDADDVTSLAGELMYDDGAVVYLNGNEVQRVAMPPGPITAATLASGHEANQAYAAFDWSAARGFLVDGENVIAVEVHQQTASSSDLVFDLALAVETAAPPPTAQEIPRGSEWRTRVTSLDLNEWDLNWYTDSYDDSNWALLPAPLGYGESYLQTTIGYGPDPAHKYVTTYFRHDLHVEDPAQVTGLVAELMYDDGLVIWLNGERRYLGLAGPGHAWGTLAAPHEANGAYETLDLGDLIGALQPGPNQIAVEVHQASATSSDLVFDMAVDVRYAQAPPVISRRSVWSYQDHGRWNAGRAPLGYGEAYVRTWIGFDDDPANRPITEYFRRVVRVEDPAAVESMRADLLYDDGVVVYLNGHEVQRLAMPAGPITPTTLSSGHEIGYVYERYDWTAARPFLVAGDNVVEAEVHQVSASSTDLTFDLALEITLANACRIPGCAPATVAPDAGFRSVFVDDDGAVYVTGTDGIFGRRGGDGAWCFCSPQPDGIGSLSAIDGGDLWIGASNGELLRYDGAVFTRVATGAAAIDDVFVAGPTDVLAVGPAGVIRHFDGAAWTVHDIPADHALHGVWGTSPDDVWIVGSIPVPYPDPDQHRMGEEAEVFRWDRATGTVTREAAFYTDSGVARFHGVGGSGPDDVWAVGQKYPSGAAAGYAFAAHFDGTSWTAMAQPEEVQLDRTYLDVVARAPGAEDGCWIAGVGGSAVRFDGAAWTQASSPLTDHLGGIAVRGDVMFAAGYPGKILRWDGAGWVRER
jgi:hypothetical protein